MAYLLFLVHGIGTHADGAWSADVTKALDTATASYAAFRSTAFSKQVSVIPVFYGDIFATQLAAWAKDAKAIAGAAASAPPDNRTAIASVTNWLTGAGDAGNFFWSHLVDVLLYRYFPDIADHIHTQVAYFLIDHLTAARSTAGGAEQVYASVMAHSLGTGVLHDVLARLGSEPLARDDGSESNAFLAANGVQFRNLFMLANTSRVLATAWNPYDSCVRPITAPAPPSGIGPYCYDYYTFRHTLDPVPAFCAFDPPLPWGKRYHATNGLAHVPNFNVHDWAQYLAHPEVHVPIVNAIFADRASPVITPAELTLATAKYEEASVPPCARGLAAFTDAVTPLVQGKEAVCDGVALITTLGEFLAAAARAVQACA